MPTSSTRKRPAAKKAATPRRPAGDKPAPIGMNFDTWTREDQVDPYVIVIGKKRYESLDPLELDFRVLNSLLDDPEALFRELFPNDHEAILANKVPLGALATFSQGVATHFGLEDFIGA